MQAGSSSGGGAVGATPLSPSAAASAAAYSSNTTVSPLLSALYFPPELAPASASPASRLDFGFDGTTVLREVLEALFWRLNNQTSPLTRAQLQAAAAAASEDGGGHSGAAELDSMAASSNTNLLTTSGLLTSRHVQATTLLQSTAIYASLTNEMDWSDDILVRDLIFTLDVFTKWVKFCQTLLPNPAELDDGNAAAGPASPSAGQSGTTTPVASPPTTARRGAAVATPPFTCPWSPWFNLDSVKLVVKERGLWLSKLTAVLNKKILTSVVKDKENITKAISLADVWNKNYIIPEKKSRSSLSNKK